MPPGRAEPKAGMTFKQRGCRHDRRGRFPAAVHAPAAARVYRNITKESSIINYIARLTVNRFGRRINQRGHAAEFYHSVFGEAGRARTYLCRIKLGGDRNL